MFSRTFVRHLISGGGLVAALLAAAAPALADSAPGMAPALARGSTVSGSVSNMLDAPQAATYALMGDGNPMTINATFTNVLDPTLAPAAFVNVWGPNGSVAAANPNVAAGAASVVFPTTPGQTYTVQVIAYPPIGQSSYTLSAQ
ncbi:MAG TPA: hypothetical protein VK009_18090 [Chloroflexota bacterium]|nr:hypothetical protein [Chloroflexota bacterium]